MEPWRVLDARNRGVEGLSVHPVCADSHHFDRGAVSRSWFLNKVKRWIWIRIKVMLIRDSNRKSEKANSGKNVSV